MPLPSRARDQTFARLEFIRAKDFLMPPHPFVRTRRTNTLDPIDLILIGLGAFGQSRRECGPFRVANMALIEEFLFQPLR